MVRKVFAFCGVAALTGLTLAQGAVGNELPDWLTERRIIGNNDLEPIEATLSTEAYDKARIVARVETADGDGFCTGSRVADDLFLTNFHCYEYKPCEELQFHLGYERDLPEAEQLTLRCKEVVEKNEELDYALFRVVTPSEEQGLDESAPVGEAARFPIATLSKAPIRVGQQLLLASHPAARMKEIDRSATCVLRTTTIEVVSLRKSITHTCDTEGGSSGSPILDRATGHVVALHWGGTDEYNLSIPMALVLADLKTKVPSAYAKLTVAN